MKEYKIITSSVWSRDYQIVNNEGVEEGSVAWKGAFSMSAEADSRFGKYKFKVNNWGTKVFVMDRRGVEIGQVVTDFWKNKTIFSYKGKTYLFKSLNWTYSAFIWQDIKKRKIFSFKSKHWGKNKGSVRVYNNKREEKENDMLMLVGTFMMIYKREQSGG